jgi:hypothetical protein
MKSVTKRLTWLLFGLCISVHVLAADNPYASKVIQFMPAPGQFTNEAIAQSHSAEAILGTNNGMVSLGGFGGYVILGFDQSIVNNPQNPYGVDFTVRGNSFVANLYGAWTEPAAVQVMKDLNGDGIPNDGEWYELAGSDYYLSTTKKNVEMTYYNPHYDVRYTIPWATNQGENGALLSNQFHSHSYYPDPFDFRCNKDSLTYSGNIIRSSLDMSQPGFISFFRAPAFGYSDNRGYNQTSLTIAMNPYYNDEKGNAADGFDISWAVDKNGNHVELDRIDFVKIYTAGNANAGWLGEWSSEVLGVGITTPDPDYVPRDYYLNYIGITQLKVLKNESCRFEGFLFKNGRPDNEGTPVWTVSDPEVGTVDDTGKFTAKEYGQTWLRFSQKGDIPSDSIRVKVVDLTEVRLEMEGNSAASSDSTSMIVGESIYITAQCIDNSAESILGSNANRYSYETYDWTTSNPETGTIQNGLFKAGSVGRTTVYARSSHNPALADSIVVIVKAIPEVKPVSDPIRIPYYSAAGTKKSSELFTTGTGSTVYLNSVIAKNGKANVNIEKNVLNYSFDNGNYGKDTLTFHITSYGEDKVFELAIIYEPDAYSTPKQLLVVNESTTSDAGKGVLKAYYPESGETKTVLDFNANSIHDMAIDGAFVYIAADDYVGSYNITNYELAHKEEQTGTVNNKLVVYNNLLFVSGYSESGAYVSVYYKTDLSLIKQIPLSGHTTDIVIANGKAYAMINSGQTSAMVLINLSDFSLEKEIPLNTNGLNVSTLLVKDTKIYGVRGYSDTAESAVLIFNTTNNSYQLSTTGGLESLAQQAPSAIEPMNGDSLLLVNSHGFSIYNIVNKEVKDGTVMSKNGLYPMGSVYDTEDGNYYVSYSDSEGKNSIASIFNAQLNEISSISGIENAPDVLKISSEITENEAPKPAATAMSNSTIYEKAATATNILVYKNRFTDKENNFNIYVRDLEKQTSWLTLNESYNSGGNLQLVAQYAGEVDTDSIVTIPVEAIDNYGFATIRTFTITIRPRIYKPVVIHPVEDIEVEKNSEPVWISLAEVFSHTASSGVTFTQSIADNSNAALVNAVIENDTLTLSFTPDAHGEAIITLRGTATHATYGEKQVETSFKVIVVADKTAPTAPTGLTAIPAETSMFLSWVASTDKEGVTGYNVYVGDEQDGTVTETNYTATGLTAQTEYTFAVEAFDSAGNKSPKTFITQTTLIPAGIAGINNDKASIYPNPFTDYIIINVNRDGKAVLYDLSGKAVLITTIATGSNRIKTSALAKGIYFLKYGSETVKVVK